MIGFFLEIAIQTADIKASLEFYEKLAFRQATVGEIWNHPYAVLTDGRVVLGLHQREFPSPCLTFVRPELAAHLERLERHGIEFESRQIDDERFNEATFLDPDGHLVCLLEARTYSPPPFDEEDFSLCGRFAELGLPVRNLERATAFWEPLGFVAVLPSEGPVTHHLLISDRINIGLYEKPALRQPALIFREPDMAERIERLREAGFALDARVPSDCYPADTAAAITSPEGSLLLLCLDEDV